MTGYYLKKSIANPVFFLCAIVLAVIMVAGTWEDLSFARNNVIPVLYCFRLTISIGIAHVVLPLIAPLPFLFFHTHELGRGSEYFVLIRGDRIWHHVGKLGAAVLSSFLVTALACIIFTLVCVIMGASWQTNHTVLDSFSGCYFYSWLQSGTAAVYLVYCLAFCLYSVPWVLTGMIASLFIHNVYIPFAVPFVVYLIWNFVTVTNQWHWLSMSMLLLKTSRAMQQTGGGIFYSLLYHIVVCLILSFIYAFIRGRQWRHEGV